MGVTQFCPECKGEVNVSMHNGATLRCGCGKTIMAGSSTAERRTVNPAVDGSSPSRPAIQEIDELMEAMIKRKALRVRTQQIEIELSPEAFAQPWMAQTSSLDADKPCRCGHSVPVQHNEHGECLEGCEAEACAEKAAA